MRCDRSTRDCCDRRRSLPSSSFPYPCSEYSFYLCRKGVRSFLVQGEKGILFLYGTFAERELTTNHIFWLFFVWRRKEISPHSFSRCRSDARRLETQTHTQTHTFDDREILQRWRRRRERRNRRWVVVQVVVVRRNRNTP